MDASPPAFFVLRAALVLATAQIACSFGALAMACVHGQAAVYRAPQIVLAIAFAVASLLLGAATSRDRRSLFALTMFATIASAFARAALAGLNDSSSMWFAGLFRGLFPEAFAPAALWQFAVVFPGVRRFTWFDVAARRVAALVWLLGGVLFGVNAALAYHALDRGALRALERDDPGNAFWHLFTLMFLPAVATILVRSRRAPAAERRKVLRFATSIAAGTGPFLACGVTRLALPRVNDWFLFAASPARIGMDWLVIGALMAMPLLATLALAADRPFARQTAMLRSLGDRIARLLAVARGVARTNGHQRRLASALEQMRLARGRREIAVVLNRELMGGTGASTARLLIPRRGAEGRTMAFVDPFRDATALASDAGLIAMCAETGSPLDLSSDSPLLTLIPETDRDWVTTNDIAMMAPLRERGGGIAAVAALGHGRGGRALDRRDRWFIRALVAAAAAAWAALECETPGDAGSVYAGRGDTAGEAAFECAGCGLVMKSNPGSCRCGDRPVLASLPWRVGAKFVVVRRIGAGGMGVVYLARDTTLDRDVALKTLPGLRGGAAARLRGEARAMAALNHESLATIYGLEFWRRTPILVVEYFPEGTLAGRLWRGRLSPDEALAIGVRLAQALTYMHARGVLHRDLKPSNVGLTAAGVPKLLDFGLATLVRTPARTDVLADDSAFWRRWPAPRHTFHPRRCSARRRIRHRSLGPFDRRAGIADRTTPGQEGDGRPHD